MTTFTKKEQRAHLRKLAEYLLTGKTRMRFTMANYCADTEGSDIKPSHHECGTIGCAVGHGPEATGINGLKDEYWYAYAERVFGLDTITESWTWCFGSLWANIDNTPEGAGKRILYYLEHGVPKNWYRQMIGNAPLCY